MLESYYAVLLKIAKNDVEAVTQAYESDSFEFEESKSRFRGTFLDQDVFFHLGEPYDKPDEELFEERKKELRLLANGIDMLHKALPVLCANALGFIL